MKVSTAGEPAVPNKDRALGVAPECVVEKAGWATDVMEDLERIRTTSVQMAPNTRSRRT